AVARVNDAIDRATATAEAAGDAVGAVGAGLADALGLAPPEAPREGGLAAVKATPPPHGTPTARAPPPPPRRGGSRPSPGGGAGWARPEAPRGEGWAGMKATPSANGTPTADAPPALPKEVVIDASPEGGAVPAPTGAVAPVALALPTTWPEVRALSAEQVEGL